MKYTGAAFLTIATMLCALTIAIAREGAHLGTYEWAVPYLAAAMLVCIVSGIALLARAGKHQEKRNHALQSPAQAHQENKNEFSPQFNPQFSPQFNPTITIGAPAAHSNSEEERLRLETEVIAFMKKAHPNNGYQTEEVARGIGSDVDQTRAALDRLHNKDKVLCLSVDEMKDGKVWVLDRMGRS